MWPSHTLRRGPPFDDPFNYQEKIIDSSSDRIAVAAGRQIGKNRLCSWRALHKAITEPGATVLIVAPTQRQSSELFKQVKTEIRDSPYGEGVWQIEREAKTILEFGNDSRIVCLLAGTDGSTIRGYTASLVIVDEAAFVADVVFIDVLSPMLATTDGMMLLASTPWGTSGYFYDAFNGAEE